MGSGLTGILNNQDAYQRWVKTARERAKFYQATLQMANMSVNSKENQHKDTRSSEILKSEKFILQVIDTVEEYNNPFHMLDNEQLYCLSSGCPVSLNVMEDVLKVDAEGQKMKEEFIKERLGKENEDKK